MEKFQCIVIYLKKIVVVENLDSLLRKLVRCCLEDFLKVVEKFILGPVLMKTKTVL